MRFAIGRAHGHGPGAQARPPIEGRVLFGSAPPTPAAPPPRRRRPRRERTGTEPVTALSDLPARRLLAGIFAPVYLLGAVLFALLAANVRASDQSGRNFFTGLAAFCALLAAAAAVDLLVIRRRMAAEHRAGTDRRHDRPPVIRGDVVRGAIEPVRSFRLEHAGHTITVTVRGGPAPRIELLVDGAALAYRYPHGAGPAVLDGELPGDPPRPFQVRVDHPRPGPRAACTLLLDGHEHRVPEQN
ncbi:hypothetical protein ABIA33_004761 [Streptacidiphilus sp. MAP12-16]|uniref:hypothetical protein n=1 Tax=Streptacidiphilus sp. MAP12-16 TaxID=3156300 RepID=UPI003514F7F9